MIESENSKRVLLKATYTPITSKENELGDRQIPFPKYNLVATIKPTSDEIQHLKERDKAKINHAKTDHVESPQKDYSKAIKIIEAVIPQSKNPNVLHNVAPFSQISTDLLLNVVDDIIKIRQDESNSAIKTINHIFDAYKEQSAQQQISGRVRESKTISSSLSQEKQEEIREQIPTLRTISPSKIKFKTLMDWAIKNNIYRNEITKIMELMERITLE